MSRGHDKNKWAVYTHHEDKYILNAQPENDFDPCLCRTLHNLHCSTYSGQPFLSHQRLQKEQSRAIQLLKPQQGSHFVKSRPSAISHPSNKPSLCVLNPEQTCTF